MLLSLHVPLPQKQSIVTASDFHKAIRHIQIENNSAAGHLHLTAVVQQLGVSRDTLEQHLHILATLDLVRLHDEQGELFSLTESGRLANLP